MRLGPYTLLKPLGSGDDEDRWLANGPMGTVIVEVWTTPDPAIRIQTAKNARETMAITHPSAVRILDAGADLRSAWVAIAPDLTEDLATAAPLPPSLAARALYDVAMALEHARARGILHGALTTRRILIGYDGIVRVTGFGSARVFDESRVLRDAVPPALASQLSPELLGKKPLVAPSDVFSLAQALAAAAGGLAALPEALRLVCVEASNADPAARLPNAGAFAGAIKAAAEREFVVLADGAALALHMRETFRAKLEEKQRDWAAAGAAMAQTPTPTALSELKIPRDPSNPGDPIPIFDPKIGALFTRPAASDIATDPRHAQKQAGHITGTWIALAEAFPPAPASSTASAFASSFSIPPSARPEPDKQELARASRVSFAVLAALSVLTLVAFMFGALYLGPRAQASLTARTERAVSRAVRPVPEFQIPPLPAPDAAYWRVPGPSPTPDPRGAPDPRTPTDAPRR